MFDMERYNDQVLPELLPLERKQTPSVLKPSMNGIEDIYRSKSEQNKNLVPDAQPNTMRDSKLHTSTSQQPNNTNRSDNLHRNKSSNAKKFNEISKNLINEMMNKISLKSITEENYPVSNQTIERLLSDLDDQIKNMTQQMGKLQNSLLLNPTNQHIKKELQGLQKNLNQLKTIKELYYEKIQHRNKISELESKIIQLKSQNRELKIKIAKGIEKIESHIHNLPCQREKALIEEVNKYKQSLNRQKDMRETLEKDIQNINLNFKRFYQQADQARKLVAQQLKTISKRQQQLKNREDILSFQKQQRKQEEVINANIFKTDNPGNSQIFFRNVTNKFTQEQNISDLINQINIQDRTYKQHVGDDLKRTKTNNSLKNNPITKKKDDNQSVRQKFNLEQQIQKMRANQLQFNKLTKRRH